MVFWGQIKWMAKNWHGLKYNIFNYLEDFWWDVFLAYKGIFPNYQILLSYHSLKIGPNYIVIFKVHFWGIIIGVM